MSFFSGGRSPRFVFGFQSLGVVKGRYFLVFTQENEELLDHEEILLLCYKMCYVCTNYKHC